MADVVFFQPQQLVNMCAEDYAIAFSKLLYDMKLWQVVSTFPLLIRTLHYSALHNQVVGEYLMPC